MAQYMSRWCVAISLTIGLFNVLNGCAEYAKDNRDVRFFRDNLGPIIFAYEKKHGELPGSFDTALKESGNKPPSRLDAYGHRWDYRKIGPHRCWFISIGPYTKNGNRTDDNQMFAYESGKWYFVKSELR